MENASMVMRYAHHYPENLRTYIEVMDSIRNLDVDKIVTKLSQLPKKRVSWFRLMPIERLK
jgi:hypothetical protein